MPYVQTETLLNALAYGLFTDLGEPHLIADEKLRHAFYKTRTDEKITQAMDDDIIRRVGRLRQVSRKLCA